MTVSGNLVSGNNAGGVYIGLFGTYPAGNNDLVVGNKIGTDITGTLPLGNTLSGVLIEDGTGQMVGGSASGDANLISGNGGDGVYISGGTSGDVVEGNVIGLDATGEVAIGNAGEGVLDNGSLGRHHRGLDRGARNVISGNAVGVFVVGAADILVAGNLIGTDARGTSAVGNTVNGVVVSGGSGVTIGGTAVLARNVVSGNLGDGVLIEGASASPIIEGNYVGVDQSGTQPLGNAASGIEVDISAGTTIGGTTPGAGNVISANAGAGVSMQGSATFGAAILGNLIGTDKSGMIALGNGTDGVALSSWSDATIGGTAAGARNVISANAGAGVDLADSDNNDLVQSNLIGTDITGSDPLGNGAGVLIAGSSHEDTIGGTTAGAGNTIAYSAGSGVDVDATAGAGNTIRDNSMFGDQGPGIVLGSGAVNGPTISSLSNAGGQTTIGGSFAGSANTTYSLDFYSMTSFVNRSYGEGRYLLGSSDVTTDSSGNASFRVSFPTPSQGAAFVTATATDTTLDDLQQGTTSPFASDYGSDSPPTAVIGFTTLTVNEGTPVHFSGLGSTDPGGEPLTYSWSFGDGGTATGSSNGLHLPGAGDVHGHADGRRRLRRLEPGDRDDGRGRRPAGVRADGVPGALDLHAGDVRHGVRDVGRHGRRQHGGRRPAGRRRRRGGRALRRRPQRRCRADDLQLRPVDAAKPPPERLVPGPGRYAGGRLRRDGRGRRQRPLGRGARSQQRRRRGVRVRRRSAQPDLRDAAGDPH